jgi:hypothetical protein
MGTPATAHGTIVFDSPEQAQTAFEQIKVWVERANSKTLPEEENGDYNIRNLELNDGKRFIVFTADSGRYQNLEWQMENLLNFCKRLKGIETFEAPIMVLSDDGIFWCADDEEED